MTGRAGLEAPSGPGDRPGLEEPGASGWPWLLAGLAAGAVGTGVAELVAVVTGPSSVPLIAASQAFVDLTPAWLKDAAIAAFGTHDKQVLLGAAGLVLAGLSLVAGLLARCRPRLAGWVVLALGAAGALAAATRPDATALSVAPAVLGAMAAAATLVVLRNRWAAGRGPAARAGAPNPAEGSRRALLTGSVSALAGGAVAAAGGRVLGAAARGAEESRAGVELPAPGSRAPALPGRVEVGVAGLEPFRVPNDEFYRIDTATIVPRLRAGEWRLRIHGMVDREITLDYAGLLAAGLVERDLTLICVSNEVGGQLTGNARWLGQPIAPLLRQAGPQAGADMVLSTSADGWTCSTPLGVLTDGRDALLAVGMNGQPLPLEHGFPVRMVVPGLYGYVSATK